METNNCEVPLVNDNVIMFPSAKRQNSGLPATVEEAKENIDAIRMNYIDQCLDFFISALIDSMLVGNFDIDDEAHAKDIALIAASVRSLMMKTNGMFHPFQEIADHAFEDQGDGYVVMKVAVPTTQPNESE